MFDFCGIGNACIDIIAKVDDGFLAHWDFPKSICTYLELSRADALEAALPSPVYIPGGCSANTAACVTALGGSAAFIGRVANDSIGALFLEDMKKNDIHYTGIPDASAGAGSTRIFALITPDSERTFASYYGVQEQLSPADLDEDAIKGARYMYLDGYALNSKRGGEAFLKAAEIAHAAGNKVVFSPSDLSILQKYGDVTDPLARVSDIVLCNEQEALYLTGTATLEAALSALQGAFETGAVTAGAHGAYAFDKSAVYHVPSADPPGPVVDTNGAGDGFAGGFLFGLARQYPLPRAAALGNRCAAAIITHAGARPVHDFKSFLTG